MGFLYVIQDNKTEMVKIGITNQWSKRAQTLQVNRKTKALLVVETDKNREHEKRLHGIYSEFRLVGTEWFSLEQFSKNALLEEVKKIGTAYLDATVQSASPIDPPWSDKQSIKHTKMFWDNFEFDELFELQIANPWFVKYESPQDKYDYLECPRLDLYFYEPKSCGGKLVNCWIYPDGTYDGEFDCEPEDGAWIDQCFNGKPKGFEQALERIWLLCSLPDSEKPLQVILKSIELQEEEKQFEQREYEASL